MDYSDTSISNKRVSLDQGKLNQGEETGEDHAHNHAYYADEVALFGETISTRLADKLAESLERSFDSNVQNLPMLRDSGPLLLPLRNSYLVHVDLLEDYCQSSIFAISPFVTSKLLAQILELLSKYGSAEEVDVDISCRRKSRRSI